MATKTISITEKAYNALKSRKKGSESFSEVIIKNLGRPKLSDFWGTISGREGEKFEKNIASARKKRDSESRKRRLNL